jgi:hypothetical protein
MRQSRTHLIRFVKLPLSEKFLFLEATVLLFTLKFVLLIFPFRICIQLMRCSKCQSLNTDNAQLLKIKYAIYRANKLSIWKNKCLVQSLAARWMLNRRRIPSKLEIGISKNNSQQLKAHAWISCGDIEIVNSNTGDLKILEI